MALKWRQCFQNLSSKRCQRFQNLSSKRCQCSKTCLPNGVNAPKPVFQMVSMLPDCVIDTIWKTSFGALTPFGTQVLEASTPFGRQVLEALTPFECQVLWTFKTFFLIWNWRGIQNEFFIFIYLLSIISQSLQNFKFWPFNPHTFNSTVFWSVFIWSET